MKKEFYVTRLQAGLGMIKESFSVLELWTPGMSSTDLYSTVLDAGVFPNVSAMRIRQFFQECFSPRFLCCNARPAEVLKCLKDSVNPQDLQQLIYVYTCRANLILNDFIKLVYWPAYAAGRDKIENDEAKNFVIKANQNGMTAKFWSEATIRRVSGYLTGICADFGLLENGSKSSRRILPFHVSQKIMLVLAYEMHFAGIGDNSIICHPDWQLFGMEESDVLDEFRRLASKGYLLVQSAGNVVRIGWKFKNIQELENVIRD